MDCRPSAVWACAGCGARFRLPAGRPETAADRARVRCPDCGDVSSLAGGLGFRRGLRAWLASTTGAAMIALCFTLGAVLGAGAVAIGAVAAPGDPAPVPPPPRKAAVTARPPVEGPPAPDTAPSPISVEADGQKSLARLLRREGRFDDAARAAARYLDLRLAAVR